MTDLDPETCDAIAGGTATDDLWKWARLAADDWESRTVSTDAFPANL